MARKEEIVARATEEAERIVAEAERARRAMRREAEDYVDAQARAVRDRAAQDPGGLAGRRAKALAQTLDQVEVGRDDCGAPSDRRRAGVRPISEARRPRETPIVRRGGGRDARRAIDVRDLVGQPGSLAQARVAARSTNSAPSSPVCARTMPVEGDLVLEGLVEGILVSGRLRGTMALRCARCLKDFEQPFAVGPDEMFVPAPDEDADDYPLDPEGSIEPEQMVRDAVGVELPFSPLCTPRLPRAVPGRAAATATWASALATTPARIRAGPGSSELSNRWTRTDRHPDRRKGSPDGRSEEEAEQDPRRQARRELEGEGTRRTPNARSAISPSSRTASAATAGTTPAGRPSRSSSARDRRSRRRPRSRRSTAPSASRSATPRCAKPRSRTARTRSSTASTITNERLEFLGDSVLGLVVTDMAYRAYPELPEGSLAKLRAAIVNMSALADVARVARIWAARAAGQGRGAERWPRQVQHPRRRARGGLRRGLPRPGARRGPRADRAAVPPADGGVRPRRGRPRLQDDPAGARVPGAAGACPSTGCEERGPDHEKEFTATVYLGGEPIGTGIGRSKKEAEQQAAREAYARISDGSPRAGTRGDEGGATRGRGDAPGPGEGRHRPAHQDGRGQELQERDARDPPSHRRARSSRRGSPGARSPRSSAAAST